MLKKILFCFLKSQLLGTKLGITYVYFCFQGVVSHGYQRKIIMLSFRANEIFFGGILPHKDNFQNLSEAQLNPARQLLKFSYLYLTVYQHIKIEL